MIQTYFNNYKPMNCKLLVNPKLRGVCDVFQVLYFDISQDELRLCFLIGK